MLSWDKWFFSFDRIGHVYLFKAKKKTPNNCIAVNTAALSGRFDLYVVVPLCSNAAVFFFSPPLAQCWKLFLLPHYIILQHLWLMHLRFRLPLSRSGEKVNFGWLPDVIITYLRFWQNTDATRRGSGETSKGIMSVLVIAQCRWFIQSGPEFEQTVNELRLCFFVFFHSPSDTRCCLCII